MNRRAIVLGAAALGLAAFAGGSWVIRDRRDREAAAAQAARAASIPDLADRLAPPTAPVLGPLDAPVTLVEFFDPSCEACRAFHPVLKQLLDEFPEDLRIVMRYAAFHQGSDEAVAILEAARRQNLFEPVLNALLDSQPNWALHDGPRLDIAWAAAAAAGLDISNREFELRSPGTVAILRRDTEDVAEFGVRATPTFFLNGQELRLSSFQGLITEVRTAVSQAGVTRVGE
jgi:protein-disulfide isomerase